MRMSQYDFDQLLEKYLAGQCDPEEEKLIFQWYERMITSTSVRVNAVEKESLRKRVWGRLYTNTLRRTKGRHFGGRSLAIAASVLVGLLVLGRIGYYNERRPDTSLPTGVPAIGLPATALGGSIEIKNGTAKPREVKLEDGSTVVLKPNSTLSYPEHFSRRNRTVFLQGEAFFDVKKDPTKPFIVRTGDLVTEVLGTSFTVKSYDKAKAIEVVVSTGRVSVYQNTGSTSRARQEVILRPNQKITYDKQVRQLIPTLVERPVKLEPVVAPTLVFKETPLPEVLKSIQAEYGIDIFVENDALIDCVLTADLNELPLYTQLDLVCRSLNATYETRGTSIFINGQGCK